MKKILLVFLLSFILSPVFAVADGAISPPIGRIMTETDQKVAIFYENGREDLILSVNFSGNADKFSWLVPTPGEPTVTKGNEKTFVELEKYTQPKETLLNRFINWVMSRNDNYGYNDIIMPTSSTGPISSQAEDQRVQVIDEKQVGIFDTVTLKAKSSEDLNKWLQDNGFQIGTMKTNKILQEYIDKGWYFVAMKINNDYQTEKISNDLNTATIAPIVLNFATDKMIYPLKISSSSFSSTASPSGSWNLTCRNNKVESNALVAECQKINGDWAQTTLDLEECQTTIQNIDGKLTCDSYYLNDYQNIYLYVFNDKKYNTENYQGYQSYAEKLSAAKTASFFDKTFGNSKSYFLTKIDLLTLKKASMSKDVLFVEAGDNKEINSGKMTINETIQLVLLAVMALLFFPIILLLSQGLAALVLMLVIYLIAYILTIVRSIKNPEQHKLLRTILQTYLIAPIIFFITLIIAFVTLSGLITSSSSSFYLSGYTSSNFAIWTVIAVAVISLVISYAISRLLTRYARKKNKVNRILAKYGDKIDNG